ncbi:acetyl-CoA carboxylase carboxyltransferase subunit beta [Lacticaseibacillus pantheris]|uniref:acetyl-CoA carboxylase carboxyltransferase subunit beta n=1 Tax=Lacticaseibacillus pantheris TaxID=171523 RepID=UPI002658FF98|nr:acetyl-CoA carboxylase carboxyltransferase subunit beta [Lacticaseibacillus pantheris]WKF84898.1 acetyl-CoA carboxylase carboxyltransferase subunit beta [Lacticaseibacillus pantheris]
MSKFNQSDRQQLAARMDKIPDNLYVKCPFCGEVYYHAELTVYDECPLCGYGMRMGALERVAMLTDEATAINPDLVVDAAVTDAAYQQKLARAQANSGIKESVWTGCVRMGGYPAALGVMDTHFMMGSLGRVAGEKLARLFEVATTRKLPVILYTASGGARMQEGLFSLMQMAKVSQAVADHARAGLLYAVMLTDPTTGGVTASFAMEADITLAEPHALVGFTGRRVIQQTLHVDPPRDFQRAETLLHNGFVDAIVPRSGQKAYLVDLLRMHQLAEVRQ